MAASVNPNWSPLFAFTGDDFAAMDAPVGPLPPENTPCIGGSCIYNGTTHESFVELNSACVNVFPFPYDRKQKDIIKYECVPQGYPWICL